MDVIIHGVNKLIGSLQVLSDIHLQFSEGLIGLFGPNGAGKTTLLNILATIDKPSSGDIHIGPYRLEKDDEAIRAMLGYLPQKFDLYPNLTGAELLDYVAYAKGIKNSITRRKEVVPIAIPPIF